MGGWAEVRDLGPTPGHAYTVAISLAVSVHT